MKFKENITIEESLVAYIRDRKTGKVTRVVLKKPYSKYTIWEKFLKRIGKDPYPGTMTEWGLERIAKCYANLSGQEHVDQIGAKYNSSWVKKSVTPILYERTLIIQNDNDVFSGGHNYTQIALFSSSGSNPHNTIDISLDLSGASDIDWWVRIDLEFT